ncbi:MAG: hypothetical protein AAGF23_06590 [Acidobacteriota bacterium]
MSQQANLLEQILSGSNRNLQVLAAQGLVPLPPEELLPIQVALTGSPDQEIAGKANQALQSIDLDLVTDFLRERAGERELRFFGLTAPAPKIVEAVLRRQDVPRPILEEMAPHLSADLQEILVHRQDAILELPSILVALESNPELSRYSQRRIWEYREHLLPRDKVPPKSADEISAEADALTDEDMEEAIAEVRAKTADTEDAEGDPVDELHNVTAAQVRMLPVPMRMKLARNADRQMRGLLIRDANSMVAVTVITANSIPDSEVEAIANNRSVPDEVLAEIPKKREWIRKYSIAKALVKNPKAPLPIALKLLPRMAVRDLRDLAKDRNVAEGVRQTALRLYQARR